MKKIRTGASRIDCADMGAAILRPYMIGDARWSASDVESNPHPLKPEGAAPSAFVVC